MKHKYMSQILMYVSTLTHTQKTNMVLTDKFWNIKWKADLANKLHKTTEDFPEYVFKLCFKGTLPFRGYKIKFIIFLFLDKQ